MNFVKNTILNISTNNPRKMIFLFKFFRQTHLRKKCGFPLLYNVDNIRKTFIKNNLSEKLFYLS